ncbi:M48 metallopeptidase family protein [Streptomyces variabilis]
MARITLEQLERHLSRKSRYSAASMVPRRMSAAAKGAGPGNGVISLHWAAFQLPIHLVDYVIAHELTHVRVAGHGPDYSRLLGRALPECRQVKKELDELGRRVWMGDLLDDPLAGQEPDGA